MVVTEEKISCSSYLNIVIFFVSIQGPGGSAPDAYPYATKRSRSLDKRGSKSFDSTNDGKESVASRRMSTIGSISGASGCNAGNSEKITQNSNNISFEEFLGNIRTIGL